MDVSRVRDPRQRGHEVRIFDRPQVFLTGPLRIAIRCKTPVLQAFLRPGTDFRYQLQIVEPLVDDQSPDSEEATIERAILRYAQNVETYVRAYPALLTRT